MRLADYINEIKLELTGQVLDLEITDETIASLINKAFREIQRYIDIPKLVTVPFASCIDLGPWVDEEGKEHEGFRCSSIVKVYRTEGYTGNSKVDGTSLVNDPMYMQQWMIYSNGGSMYNLDNYVMNFLSYNTMLQMRNTISTDMSWKEDKEGKKLYINCAYDSPKFVTIEYIPVYQSVEEVEDDYWTDQIAKLSLALVKITLGRIRTYSKQSNAIWTLDGDTLLQEGTAEAENIRNHLIDNMNFMYPID
jgi:hypothetical protein